MLEAAALAAALFLLANPVHAAATAAKPAGCLIEPEQIADVGSPVTGVIEALNVALGDNVDAGQAVVRLRADVERANANVALLRAQVDAEVKAAQANLDLARQKVHRTEQLLAQNFMSTQALEQARAETEVAAQKLKLAQAQQSIYAREEAVAQAQLNLRTLRSPIKGVVIERYSNLGERVEDKPVVRIASIDPLRVSLMVPIAQYGQVAVGNALVIRPDMPGVEPVKATVTYVDKVVDAASNSFRVRLSLPNPGNRLPGGLRCKADLAAQAAPAAPPAKVSATPASLPPVQSMQPAAPPQATRMAPPNGVQAKAPVAAPAVSTAQTSSVVHTVHTVQVAQAVQTAKLVAASIRPVSYVPPPRPVPASALPNTTAATAHTMSTVLSSTTSTSTSAPSSPKLQPAAPALLPAELALRPTLSLSGRSLKHIALREALSPFVDQLSFPPSSPLPAKHKKKAEPSPRLNATYTLASAR